MNDFVDRKSYRNKILNLLEKKMREKWTEERKSTAGSFV